METSKVSENVNPLIVKRVSNILLLNNINIFFTLFHSLVCRISPDTTCNIHGVTDECADDKCNCKDGYTGDLCEYCEPFCMITDNSIQEGEVDVTSGEGVHCSCKLYAFQ